MGPEVFLSMYNGCEVFLNTYNKYEGLPWMGRKIFVHYNYSVTSKQYNALLRFFLLLFFFVPT